MKSSLIRFFILPFLVLLLTSWGGTGHYTISRNAALSFSTGMLQFSFWADSLAAHASDPDYRKSSDPGEGHKHYIDIDNYPEFISNGRIALTLDSVVDQHGQYFVDDQGILPWATRAAFDSLKDNFARKDFQKALYFASDLGHYVADAHMPMHITKNYNGQFSGNDGIHSRYESVMINKYINEIKYTGYEVNHIDNVNSYIFSYLYKNYRLTDSILKADNYAVNLSGGIYSDNYYKALWDHTKYFTINLFSSASHSLAELIYTAWVDAGKPQLQSSFIRDLTNNAPVLKVFPVYVTDSAVIEFSIPQPAHTRIEIIDFTGKKTEVLTNSYKQAGSYSVTWHPVNRSGVFLCVLYTGTKPVVKKIIVQ